MADVNSITDPLASLRLQTAVKKTQLGQDDFLKLMTTQLKNQDPMKPLDNAQFMGQIAQFSTVQGIQDLQKSFASLSASMQSSQALQSVALVGRSALVAGDQLALPASGNVGGAFDLPASASDVAVDIADASGQIVRHVDLGAQAAGTQNFTWDGTDDTGARVAAGTYLVAAHGLIGGTTQALNTSVAVKIDSVSIDPSTGGVTLNLEHIGPTPISDVSQFM